MAPAIEEPRRPQGAYAYELAGRFWNHAPAMFTSLRRDGIAWPETEPAEMADVMAYLQADASRDPDADPFQEHILVFGKGCLKCQRYRGEGGKISDELTQYNPGYQSPVAWAASVWKHAPAWPRRPDGWGVVSSLHR